MSNNTTSSTNNNFRSAVLPGIIRPAMPHDTSTTAYYHSCSAMLPWLNGSSLPNYPATDNSSSEVLPGIVRSTLPDHSQTINHHKTTVLFRITRSSVPAAILYHNSVLVLPRINGS